ncbi:MAG: polymer-forming cytoskeletal family protein [Spirochaetaceae bacterium]|nr:MAG: polymer-forming cytoskeletal family protein [Spirochaetaceae bacterium]
MKAKRKTEEPKPTVPRTATRLGRNVSLKGTLRFRDSVRVSGRLEGEIISDGFLYVEEGAEVRADVRVGSAVIAGVVRGNIHAADSLEMLPSGKIYGNVRAAKLRIADGVVFEGKCEMIKNPNSVDIFSAPVDQLKASVPRV